MIEVNNLSKEYLILPYSIRLKFKYIFSLLFNFKKINSKKHFLFKSFLALNKISFFAKKGELIGIVGLNGSGKSTLLKVLMGFLENTHGYHNVQEQDVDLIDHNRVVLGSELTIIEAIEYNLLGFSSEEKVDLTNKILSFFEFLDIKNSKVRTLSLGMQSRLVFGISLISQKKILLIDEILGAGDPYWNERCLGWIKNICEGEKIILMTSHNTQILQKFCKKGIWLHEGNLKSMGPMHEVAKDYETHALSLSFTGISSVEEENLDGNYLNIKVNKQKDVAKKDIQKICNENKKFKGKSSNPSNLIDRFRINSNLSLVIENIFVFDSFNKKYDTNTHGFIKIKDFPKRFKIVYKSNKAGEYFPTALITFWGFDGTRLFTTQNKSFKLIASKYSIHELNFKLPKLKLSELNMYVAISLFSSELMNTANEDLSRQDFIYKFCEIRLNKNFNLNFSNSPFENTQFNYCEF